MKTLVMAAVGLAMAAIPQDAKKALERAQDRYQKGQYDGAVADATYALELDPKLAAAFYIRGLAKEGLDDVNGALADYGKAIDLDPKDVRVFYRRANARESKGDVDGALADYTRAIELAPNDASLVESRAYLNFDRGAWAAALADFRKSLELSPAKPEYRRLRVWVVRARLGESEAATKDLAEQFKDRKDDWPGTIARFLTGRLPEPDFLKAADADDADLARERRCEAFFYAGSRRSIDRDAAGAAAFFKKCVETGVSRFTEHQSASAALKAAEKGK